MSNLMPFRYNRYPVSRPVFDLFQDDFFKPFFTNLTPYAGIRVDVRDEGDHYLLEADLPGINKGQLSIDIEDGVMTISAEMNETKEEKKDNYIYNERRVGSFRRAFNLNGIDEDNVKAEYLDGVLKMNLPKVSETPKTGRKVEIQ